MNFCDVEAVAVLQSYVIVREACERDMQEERRHLPKEAHENRFYSLSESAEDSY